MSNDVPVQSSYPAGVFRSRLQNVRSLVVLLRAIQFKERAVCTITPNGLKFSVEESRCVQAHAYLQSSLFQEYQFDAPISSINSQENIVFGVQLNTLIECLNIFGTANLNQLGNTVTTNGTASTMPVFKSQTALVMSYEGYGANLVLTLEDNGVITVCKLSTFEPENLLSFNFQEYSITQKIIMKSEWLRDALSELDISSEKITFLISPQPPYFRMSTIGISGSTEMDYPRDTDVLESFYCTETMSNSYKLSQVQHALKALVYSSKTSIRTNEKGFLAMQFMIPAETEISFVELLCSPLEIDLNEQEAQ
ncbi:cell cycle checkpoint protein RAD1 [Basidiobolus meristosporus CBS 931.73]|uniref:Cell cycle checkpoint protein RAD1 n=1 Tax=Basidiobolus meristosporus CBS 931.73 TaxID=1314790 RepID=A0A1Y1ZDX0_9FUNG|nr:cell cycle checkpoint protein RAD1 [Basidiobolus meristosporus CBS 931.73]|eukprot:ORY08167.1 cell cycle checkpoint protein RAD1 [Basidiobolus meristosporus CBS 931.73]